MIVFFSVAIEKLLKGNFGKNYHENYKVSVAKALGGIELFRLAEPAVTVLLSVTSPVCRPPVDLKQEELKSDGRDLLPNEQCLRALADLRRAKWFHVS